MAHLFSLLAFLPMGVQTGKRLLRTGRYDVIGTPFVPPTGPAEDAFARFADVLSILSVH